MIHLYPLVRDGDRPPFATRFVPLELKLREEINPNWLNKLEEPRSTT